MRVGSLFSGIGGLELGLEHGLRAAGLVPKVVFQVERSAFCRHLLARHWPHAQRFDDVCTVGASILPAVDLLCGGFPCQDVSAAGGGEGLGTEDNPTRSGLWFQFRRIIEETRPRWVVVENVASGAKRWLPRVRRDLWTRGYASVPVGISAAEVGARHRRERVFVVAHLDGQGELQPGGLLEQHGAAADVDSLHSRFGEGGQGAQRPGWAEFGGGPAPYLDCAGLPHGQRERGDLAAAPGAAPERDPGAIVPWQGMPARPWMVRGVHGLSGGLDGPWRRAGWTPARLRAARIAALGNAVVPAQVEPVGRLIGMVER